jgi:hypothetical protein
MDPRAGLDDVEKRKFLTLLGLELPVASRCTGHVSLTLEVLIAVMPAWFVYRESPYLVEVIWTYKHGGASGTHICNFCYVRTDGRINMAELVGRVYATSLHAHRWTYKHGGASGTHICNFCYERKCNLSVNTVCFSVQLLSM